MRALFSVIAIVVLCVQAPGCNAPLDSFDPDAGSSSSDGGVNGPLCEGYDEVICPDGQSCIECPAGGECYDGLCLPTVPDCMSSDHPDYDGWPNDSDLEPNGIVALATTLRCGDDGVVTDPVEYHSRCPDRRSYSNGFMNLLLCPEGERDLYRIYMLEHEVLDVRILHDYSTVLPRDLDLRIRRWSSSTQDWLDDIAVAETTNDDEQAVFDTGVNSGNLEGWYYIEVSGKTRSDVNSYTVSFTLNATQIW